jgi:hypothetical protein
MEAALYKLKLENRNCNGHWGWQEIGHEESKFLSQIYLD